MIGAPKAQILMHEISPLPLTPAHTLKYVENQEGRSLEVLGTQWYELYSCSVLVGSTLMWHATQGLDLIDQKCGVSSLPTSMGAIDLVLPSLVGKYGNFQIILRD